PNAFDCLAGLSLRLSRMALLMCHKRKEKTVRARPYRDGARAAGMGFVERSRYTVYVYGDVINLVTGICSRTKNLDAAQEDLTALGGGRPPEGACCAHQTSE